MTNFLIEYDPTVEEATRALADYVVTQLALLGHDDPAEVYRLLGYDNGAAYDGAEAWELAEALCRAMNGNTAHLRTVRETVLGDMARFEK